MLIAIAPEYKNVTTDITVQKTTTKTPVINDTIIGLGLMKCNIIW
jgi:hypothetical protein